MTTLTTGETLPEYDDPADSAVDVAKLHAWLASERGWYANPWMGDPAAPKAIADVLAALQAVGNATLVKNATYRAMRRDSADIERLNAWLANNGKAELLVQHDGDAVAAAVTALTIGQR